MKIVAVSGGFDPIHVGHIELFREAKKLGNRLVVILNSDDFLMKKKGYIFMHFDSREEIVRSIRYVDDVVRCVDNDLSVCRTLELVKPDIFANGGDRVYENIAEKSVCERLGIQMVFGIGGGKIQSSSQLLKKYENRSYSK